VAWGVLVALTLVLLTPGVALADQENYYLGPEGVPQAQMMMNPLGGEMPNYDRGRDVEPGLLLERTTLGLAEDDAARHQQWLIDLSGQRLAGFPSMVVWSAAAGFEAGKHGVFTLYVLDCDRSGANCERLGSRSVAVDTGAGGDWVESVVGLSELDHTFGEGRNLAVRLVVPSASDTDMMFAYGYAAHRSRLTIHSERPAPSGTQTAQLSAPAPVDFAMDLPTTAAAEAAPIVAMAAPSEDVPEEAGSIWPWLITLALSTAGLVAVGALLMATLTKPGRHQQSNEPVRVKSDGLSRVGSSEL
jgi:hypothetical protein